MDGLSARTEFKKNDYVSGKVPSTVSTYKYHMQIQEEARVAAEAGTTAAEGQTVAMNGPTHKVNGTLPSLNGHAEQSV